MCENILVIQKHHSPILGRPTIEALKLMVWIEPVTTTDLPMTKVTILSIITTERLTIQRSAEVKV